MSLKKKTIRRLPEKTREIARIINELESVLQRLKNRLPVIAGLEFESQALAKARNLISLQSARETVKKAAQETSEQEPLFPDNTPQENPARKKRQRKEKQSNAIEPQPEPHITTENEPG